MVSLLWLTKEVPVLLFCGLKKMATSYGSPALIQEVPDLALLWLARYPRGTGSNSSAASGNGKSLGSSASYSEGTSTDSDAAYPRGATRR
jgi:hypothetical protein